MNNWSVYILLCADNSFYIGATNDIKARIIAHNASRGAKYTRSRLPVSLIYSTLVGTKSAAMKLEYKLKQLTRKQKEELIYGNNKA